MHTGRIQLQLCKVLMHEFRLRGVLLYFLMQVTRLILCATQALEFEGEPQIKIVYPQMQTIVSDD